MGRGEMGTEDFWWTSERLIDARDELVATRLELLKARRERDALYKALKDVLEGRYKGKARRLIIQLAPERR